MYTRVEANGYCVRIFNPDDELSDYFYNPPIELSVKEQRKLLVVANSAHFAGYNSGLWGSPLGHCIPTSWVIMDNALVILDQNENAITAIAMKEMSETFISFAFKIYKKLWFDSFSLAYGEVLGWNKQDD